MPGMSSAMVTKVSCYMASLEIKLSFLQVQLCTICHKQEVCKSSFKDIALALRFDYILNEDSGLSDARRVALYREYRGIGGET